ncbi:hypothetical protein PRIPAC_87888 [Pristionchus pacificus]|uniref:Uncharacterized protein n=1 Tax=Pristionchus pacificus TaxID=54126 RepID=A0A454XXE6_PRIPA|nr:hypothetical protein PRIPAC_87888 [Pristionchus pacificus]|eukprot:PDM61706.1 hypothetical protein PRIPAC_51148 [Pristionchus pacificus]
MYFVLELVLIQIEIRRSRTVCEHVSTLPIVTSFDNVLGGCLSTNNNYHNNHYYRAIDDYHYSEFEYVYINCFNDNNNSAVDYDDNWKLVFNNHNYRAVDYYDNGRFDYLNVDNFHYSKPGRFHYDYNKSSRGKIETELQQQPDFQSLRLMFDIAATAAQLWNVNFYYNWFFGTHAFCADTLCTDAIKANGIGYDMNFGKGVVGKAVSEASIAAVRTACPIGSANLRNLGFEKSGKHYVHNLNGVGLKQGWVSTVNGACGAKVPIKRWKSRFTDDMMYTVNLEWNMWYQGMIQDNGQVLFYMWE